MPPMDDAPAERATDGPASILVGVDGSVTAARAGWYAAGLARRQHARVTMVYVAPLLSPWQPWDAGLETAWREAAGQAAEDMRRKAAAFAADLGVEITFLAVRGDPFTELRRIAEEIRADAVVVGASAHAGHRPAGGRAFPGSTRPRPPEGGRARLAVARLLPGRRAGPAASVLS